MTLTEPAPTTWAPSWRTRSAFWWILLSAMAVAVYAPLPYALNSLVDLTADGEPLAANYVDRSDAVRLAFYLHVGFGGLALLLVTLVLATAGLACVGTLYGGLTAGFTGRETLLPLLVLPVVAPVLIGATRAVEAALGTGGTAIADGWPWVGVVAVFAVAFGVGGTLAFGPLIDE